MISREIFEVSFKVNEPDEVVLTFKNSDTKKDQEASIHIKDPEERVKFLGLIRTPLEELEYGFFKDTISPQDILDMVVSQIKLQGKPKPNKKYPQSIYFESPSTQSFFKRDGEGNYIAYHWEGGESYDEAGRFPLSMETLNERPLFIGPSPDEWDPKHLPDRKNYTLYQIKIKPMDLVRFTEFDTYHSLLTTNKESSYLSESEYLERLKSFSFRLFVLGENDQNELKEAFLLNPRKYIISIEKIEGD